ILAPLLLAGLAGIPKLMAQSAYNSNVQGTIFDNKQAVIPGAKVRLRNMELGVEQNTTSNSAGIYRFNSIAPGSYEVVVETPGFAKSVTRATVTADTTVGVDVTLQLATTVTNVTVTSQAQALNTDETRLEFTIKSDEMLQLPLQNESTLAIMKAAPGVVGIMEQTNDISIGEGAYGFAPAYANGKGSSSNLFLLDGLSIMDSGSNYGLPQFSPNNDMLDQVTLQTNTFSVENGSSSSIQVDYVTKSGTNKLHGDIDYMWSDKLIQATPTLSEQAPYRRDWVHGSIGGPIIRDHTFFFASYENAVNLNSGSSAGQVDLSPAFVQWATTAFPNGINLNNTYAKPVFAIDFSKFLVQSTGINGEQAYGPQNAAANTGCGTPSTHDVPCDLDSAIYGYFNQAPYVKGFNFNGRIDQYFNDSKDRVYLNFFRFDQNSDALNYRDAMTQYSPSQSKYAGAGYTHVFSPTLLNQASFAFTREWDVFGGGSQAYATVPYENLICCNPFMIFSTFFGPTGDRFQNYAGRDAISWVKGKHSLTFGFQADHPNYWQDRSGIYSRPFFPFFCCSTLSYFEDPSAGYSLYTISAQTGKWQGQYYGAGVNQLAAYVQDQWKITPNFLLTLGIRWDDYGNPSNWGRDSGPYAGVFLGTGSTLAERVSNAYTKLVQNAFNGAQDPNFIPRVGFAWSPFGHKQWSVRGGFGLYEDAMNLSGITANLPTQPPSRLSVYAYTSPANMYGTNSSSPPFGFNYPAFPISGHDSRGGVYYPCTSNASGQCLYADNINGVDPDLVPEKTAIFNFSVQRELPDRVVVGATYSGSRSWDQYYGAGNPASGNLGWNVVPGQQLNGGSATGLTQEWGAINETLALLTSNYNALILIASHQGARFTWQASYTWSRTFAEDCDGFLENPYQNATRDYGPSGIDVPNRLSLSGVYQFPHPAGRTLNAILGGWSLGSIIVAQDGSPFDFYTTNTSFNPGAGQGLANGSGDFLADGGDVSKPDMEPHILTHGFTRAQLEYAPNKNGVVGSSAQNYAPWFTIPAGYGTVPVEGNEAPNCFRNPGYFSVDGNINKAITLPWFFGETSKLNLSVQAYNLFNRPNLGGINNNFAGSNVGLVTTAYQPRTFELHARFEF
ncbi:MAG TPA: carboxypeptidase regulatory-like domain-containing protein, partial [Terriglobia bacterium]|nr:carboxypeptidase regulatory-like domain-containing protein [Terriglobia bacterium]